MFLWYIEWAAKDRHQELAFPDTQDWQARLIAEAEAPGFAPAHAEPTAQTPPLPPLKRAG